ncbi:N-acetylgalactosaminyltransferase 7 isoform X2 [Parasteatoda tepidariorum]|uniref:N-acetylgalactosaminyltransferase 7 isoform X2 n=1 Tax=Parasteatoda tepidariorum TaxID=114398 RepID=UPI001C718052|nr:N-acetylgalactosaminyltransferase 7 isoform X2 [Parasteatoda tepidariorum]
MKVVSLRKSRLLKVLLVIVVFILLVAFFIPKPKGVALLSGKVSKSKLVPPRLGPIFKEGVLGNFEPSPTETIREGPGENGMAHYARSEDQNEISIAMMEYGINMVVSNQISLDRSIPDKRLHECKYWHYPKDLPTTSVIIVFHNEGFSTLLRTVHSVINRSPPEFLKEVVLVDDFSEKENLKGELEDYIRQFGQKVRLTRNKQREGLIRSRTYGAEFSKGEVIVFLDAHCEVNVNWLPPLLAPIYTNRTVMTVPVIDGIDKDSFEYRPVYQGEKHFRGIFEWGMLYKEIEIPEEEERRRRYHSEPYKSPTHAGGLFAINREYFLELGAYDPGLLVWGGENFELSFKIWQCGGSIEWVPCSRVGHIYRGFMPYSFGKLAEQRKGPLVTLNYKRVVEVWMDDYKDYFYIREPIAKQYDHGDISGQLAIKERLQCKSFKWFMDNVAYDVLYKFPLLPKNLFWGEVRSMLTGQCMDTMSSQPPSIVGMSHCHGSGGNQVFRLNAEGQLGVGERCVDADTDHVKLVFCSLGTVDGPWEYNETKKMLYHKQHRKCLELSHSRGSLHLQSCNDNSNGQKWIFKELVVA